MKTWWLHLTIGCVLMLSGIAAWHSWMLSTRENPVVVVHRHIYMPDTEERRICDCSNEFRDMQVDIRESNRRAKEFGDAVNGLTLEVKDLKTVNQVWQQFIEKRLKQHRHGCGEW